MDVGGGGESSGASAEEGHVLVFRRTNTPLTTNHQFIPKRFGGVANAINNTSVVKSTPEQST